MEFAAGEDEEACEKLEDTPKVEGDDVKYVTMNEGFEVGVLIKDDVIPTRLDVEEATAIGVNHVLSHVKC